MQPNGEFSQPKVILKKDYHLSYPFIYYEKNIFYLLPESSQNNSLAIWKSIKFPKQWKIHKILFKGESCADPTLLKDKKGQTWLFVNKTIDKFKKKVA